MLSKIKGLLSGNQQKYNYDQHLVLIVEDSQIDQRIVNEILTKQGFRTLSASNGQEALELTKSHHPDLIILDCEMPVMGGVEMCKILKQTQGISETPVVFLTSLDTPKNIIDCFELDAENYLSKPISPKILLSEVNNVLKITSN